MMRETAGAAAGPLPISMRQPTLLQAPPRAGSSQAITASLPIPVQQPTPLQGSPTPASGVTRTHSNQQDMVIETAERRRLLATLAGIGSQLQESRMNDPLSQSIADWHRQFVQEVRSSDNLDGMLGTYVTRMQGILRDAATDVPLDERALLGSDGRTYNFMSYHLYRHAARAELRERSPLELDNPARLTTSPHYNAAFMIRWLQTHNALQRSPDLEHRYALIEPPPIPVQQPTRLQAPTMAVAPQAAAAARTQERRERLRRIEAMAAERARQDAEEDRALIEQFSQMTHRVEQIVEESFAPIHERVAAVGQRVFARADAIQREDAERMEEARCMVGRLESDVGELEYRNVVLDRSIESVSTEVTGGKRDNVQLERDINSARIAIRKRESSSIGGLLQSVAVIGACAFATWALAGVLQGVAIFPTGNGVGVKMLSGVGVKVLI